jgi:hypothetical protein
MRLRDETGAKMDPQEMERLTFKKISGGGSPYQRQ